MDGAGLDDALLHAQRGGAATVLGTATLTSAANDASCAELLVTELGRGDVRIGDAMLDAKIGLAGLTSGAADIQLGFTLLGDPALHIEGIG